MLATLLLATTLGAQPEFAFAFSDASGTRLLALGSVVEPGRLTRATCDGRVLDVAFLARQPRGANDSGRQTSSNFDQAAGMLYEIRGTPAPSAASCLLATASFFAAHPPAAATAVRSFCDAGASAAVARLGKRIVERCEEVGRFPGGRFVIVIYARSGKDLLAGLVLLTEEITAMRAFPASAEEGAPSCWRADDGCVFETGSHHVPFALMGPGGPTLFALWDGPEGQNLELLAPKGGVLETMTTEYRYWVPE